MSIRYKFSDNADTKKLEQEAYLPIVNGHNPNIISYDEVTENHIQAAIRKGHKRLCKAFIETKVSKTARELETSSFGGKHPDL